MPLSKPARFAEFLDRLAKATPCANAPAALQQLSGVLDAVEDEYSGTANRPEEHISDGRMYPPQEDAARPVEGRPELTRYRNKAHHTYISAQGAVLIIDVLTKDVVLTKPGADGSEIQL